MDEDEIGVEKDENGNPFCPFCQTYHDEDSPCPETYY